MPEIEPQLQIAEFDGVKRRRARPLAPVELKGKPISVLAEDGASSIQLAVRLLRIVEDPLQLVLMPSTA